MNYCFSNYITFIHPVNNRKIPTAFLIIGTLFVGVEYTKSHCEDCMQMG